MYQADYRDERFVNIKKPEILKLFTAEGAQDEG